MKNDNDIQLLVKIVLLFTPEPLQGNITVVVDLLSAIADSQESKVWKKSGDDFMKMAVNAAFDNDSHFYTMIGTACLGRSVVLERSEKLKSI